ncbi:MAG: AAA-like domain-containing protein [Nitrospirales bacterium]|nr:AAA-like domain-containing protein [Nitrospirales bacterium]
MNLPNNPTYSNGRTVKARNLQYLPRPADDEVFEYCREGLPAYILTSPQMGKSSILARTAERLKQASCHPIIIDLSQFPLPPQEEEWFKKILFLIENTLDLTEDTFEWWDRHDSEPFPERLTTFVEEVLLTEVPGSVIFLIDEIEQTLTAPFRVDFFAWLASLYEARANHPIFQRVTFVLCGVATPRQLIPDHSHSLFQWSQEVVLSDFTLEEALPLADSLSLPNETGKTVIGWVHRWTNGHPYLTQLLSQVIEEQNRSTWTEAEVGACIENFLISPQGIQDRNLQIVRCALTEPSFSGVSLLEPYLKLLEGKGKSIKNESLIIESLRLAGVVRGPSEDLDVRNQVYQIAFPIEWVNSHLPKPAQPAPVQISKAYAVAASLLLLSLGFAFGALQSTKPTTPISSSTEISPPEASTATFSSEELQSRIDEQRLSLATADKTIAKLEATVKQYQTLSNSEVKQVTAQMSQLQDQLEAKEDKLEEAAVQIQELESTLRDSQQTNGQNLNALRVERDQLARKYSSVQEELDTSKNQLHELQTALLKQSTLPPAEVKKLLADRSQLDERLKAANKELAESYDRNRELESLLGQQKQVAATESKRQIESLNRLENQLRDKDLALEQRQQDFKRTEGTLREQLKLSQTELSRIQDSRSQLQNQLLTQKQEMSEYSERLARLDALNTQQRQAVEKTRQDNEQLTGQLQAIRNREAKLQNQTTHLEALLTQEQDTAKSSIHSLRQEKDRLNNQLSQSQSELQNAKNEVAALTTQLTIKTQDTENRQATIKDIQATSKELSQRNETLLVDLVNSRNRLETQLAEAQATLRQTQQQVRQSEVEEAQYASLQKDVQRISAERDQFSSQLKQATQQLEKANQEVKHLQTQATINHASAENQSSISSSQSARSSSSGIAQVLPVITSAISSSDRFPQSDPTRLLWARQAFLFNVRDKGIQWAPIDQALREGLHASPISFPAGAGRINALAFHPLGGQLASGTSDGGVWLWNPENPKQAPKNLSGHSAGVLTIQYSPDGKFVASGSLDTSVRVFSVDQPDTPPVILSAHIKGVTSLAFSPDGKTLASSSQDHTIRLWDLSSKTPGNKTLGTHAGWVNSITFTPDGRFLISGGDDLTIKIWDVRHPEAAPRILQGHAQSISTLAVHPSGSVLASGGRDQQIALWDLRDLLAPPRYLVGHSGRVSDLQFSSDGQVLISVSSDKTTRIWDWQHPSSAPVILSNQKGSLDAVAISPDGVNVATGGAQKMITLWAVTPKLAETVCDGVQRNLSISEWQELVGTTVPYERTCMNLPLHPSYLEEAKNLARKGESDKAIKFFQRAKVLDSSLDLDPKKEVEKFAAKS